MSDTQALIFEIILVLASAICSFVILGLRRLNHYSLKSQAQSGNRSAKAVYPLHAVRNQYYISLLITKVFINTLIVITLHNHLNGYLTFLYSALIILIFCELLPSIFLRKNTVLIIGGLAPVLRKLNAILLPLVKPVAGLLDKQSAKSKDSSMSKDAINQIIESAEKSKGSSLSPEEFRMLRSVLNFDDKEIRDVMTPSRMVQTVTKDDQVGPILMDELHKSGYSRFPVVSQSKNNIFVGTLYLRDLVGETGSRKVKDLMSPQVFYIHEEESLSHALRTFLKTHHHLFVVVNSFEEFVGVLSIEDVLEEIIGKEIVDEFDKHDDLRAVASSLAEKDSVDREKDASTK